MGPFFLLSMVKRNFPKCLSSYQEFKFIESNYMLDVAVQHLNICHILLTYGIIII